MAAVVCNPDQESQVADVTAVPQDLPWYAVHVRSKFERAVSSGLHEKHYDPFLPLYPAKRQWSDRVKQIELPLFPGYVFCRLDVSARLLPVLTTPGVLGIVSAGKTPLPISDPEIEAVQAVLRSGLPTIPWPSLVTGSRVVLEAGPLAGLEGVILSIRKKYRLVVSVPLLHRGVAVEIEREWVRPASTHHHISAVVSPATTWCEGAISN